MDKKRLVVATAAAAGFVFGCASAHATVIPGSVQVTYTTGTTNLYGNAPGITDDIASGFTYTTSGLSERNFLTTAPTGTSCGSNCYLGYMASDQINFNFTITDAYGGTGTFSTFATYYAKYSGTALGCDPGKTQSDCIIWSGSGGSYMSLDGTGNGSVTYTVDLLLNGKPDGSVVDLTFYNVHDWTITSEISGTYLYTPPQHQQVPEPASFVLLASGIAGLGVARRCVRRKPSKKRNA